MIRIENINKIYEGDTYEIQALKDISLNIDEGEFVSIMGRSGSGKTTLLNIIGFLDTPTSGSFYFGDIDVSKISAKRLWKYRRENIGFVFQNFALIEHNTVFENVILPLEALSTPHRKAKKTVDELLERVGIKELRNKYPAQISGGQKQRVAIARALAANPRLVLADEPTGALDVDTGNEILNLFKEINEQGKTVIIVTHDEKIAAKTRRLIRLEQSVIVDDKPVLDSN